MKARDQPSVLLVAQEEKRVTHSKTTHLLAGNKSIEQLEQETMSSATGCL